MDSSDDLNLLSILDGYLSRLLTLSGPGMKSLLLDALTTQSIAVVTSQTNILQKEVYLMQHVVPAYRPENVKARLLAEEAAASSGGGDVKNPMTAGKGAEPGIGDKMPHLKGVVFVRPTAENVQAICRELNAGGRFSE